MDKLPFDETVDGWFWNHWLSNIWHGNRLIWFNILLCSRYWCEWPKICNNSMGFQEIQNRINFSSRIPFLCFELLCMVWSIWCSVVRKCKLKIEKNYRCLYDWGYNTYPSHSPLFLFRLKQYIKHLRQCFIGLPDTSNFVKNTLLRMITFWTFSLCSIYFLLKETFL